MGDLAKPEMTAIWARQVLLCQVLHLPKIAACERQFFGNPLCQKYRSCLRLLSNNFKLEEV